MVARLEEQHLLPVLVAAKAALLDPAPGLVLQLVPAGDVDSQHWWTVEGIRWIEQLCHQLNIQEETLASAPTRDDVQRIRDAGLLPRELDLQIALLLLRLSIVGPDEKDKKSTGPQLIYTAATRALIARTLDVLQVPPRLLLTAERQIADELFSQLSGEMKGQTETARKKREHGWGGSVGRWAATGVGVVLGGVAIGVTGGLAAPLLVPLVPFLGLSAAAAPVVLGSLFGLAGGGLTGYRVRRRWAGVDHFEFVDLSSEMQDDKEKAVRAPSMTATILVPGLQVRSENETMSAARGALPLFEDPAQDVFVLAHSPQFMYTVGKTLDDWILGQVVARTTTVALKMTALGAMMTALAAPMAVYTAGTMIDNDWVRACDKASKAGVLLAEVLRERVQGARSAGAVHSRLNRSYLRGRACELCEVQNIKAKI